MTLTNQRTTIILAGIVCGLLLASVVLAGCTSGTQPAATPAAPAAPAETVATMNVPASPAAAPVATTAAIITTGTPAPAYTAGSGTVIAFTAASLKGVSPKLAADFEKV